MFEVDVNKIASQRKTHAPQRFLYLRETKSWWCEGGGGGGGEGEEREKVHLLTHATARGVGKNVKEQQQVWGSDS